MVFGRKTTMVSAEAALPGRAERPYHVPEKHAVNGNPLFAPEAAERKFWQTPGVWVTAVGYSGGYTPNPTYEETCTARTGHTEAVLVVFDPTVVTYEQLLKLFWEDHDPTQGMRQGNDVGTQYRSGIYYANESQKQTAEMMRSAYDDALRAAGHQPVTTEVEPAKPFYYAEEAHQQYLHKVPNGYCGLKGTGVSCKLPQSA